MASFEVYREFYFEAAHALYDPEAKDGGKYRNLHGHSFRVRVTVRGERHAEEQWVIDLGKLGRRLATGEVSIARPGSADNVAHATGSYALPETR